MTILEYRKQMRESLGCLFGEEAPPLCDILLCEYLGVDKSTLLQMYELDTPEEVMIKMDDAVDQLGLGVPVQYVIGNCWFFGKKVQVGKGVFIPRSDTEILVQTALAALPENGTFADICTGSGCISLALASTRKDVKGYALDISAKALSYAEKNLAECPNVTLREFDAVEDEDYEKLTSEMGKVDVIVCNPPYIRTADIDFLDQQVQYEPHNALDGGEDGLRFYRAVTHLAPILLKDTGTLIYELGYDQANDVGEIMRNAGFITALVKDYNKINRVILGKKY